MPVLQSAGDANWFKVYLVAGQTYNFSTSGSATNAHLAIYSATGAKDQTSQYLSLIHI